MTDKTLERMISEYLKIKMPLHQICFQGGEPTIMGLNFYQKAVNLIEKYGSGKKISLSLQTNGTLLNDEWGKFLHKYNFLVGISVDGPKEIHNKYRKTSSNEDSHHLVMRGLNILKKHNIEHNILSLVTKANINKAEEIYLYNKNILQSKHHQYIECVEFDNTDKLCSFCPSGDEWGNFLCSLFDIWYKDRYEVSVRLFDSILFKMVEQKANVCVMNSNCRQYLMVENNGDLFPCDFFMLPELKLGNIFESNGFLNAWNGDKIKNFGKRKSQYNEKCSNCKYLNLCHGCCQKNRSKDGINSKKLSVLCSGWKMFYDYTYDKFKALAEEIKEQRQQELIKQQMEQIRMNTIYNTPKNAPCPCGSGKKYKRCCANK